MGPVSRWWATRRASNAAFGLRRPPGRDANGVLMGADTGVVITGDPGHARAPAWRSHPDRQRIILALPRAALLFSLAYSSRAAPPSGRGAAGEGQGPGLKAAEKWEKEREIADAARRSP